jgi:hypothetical protein
MSSASADDGADRLPDLLASGVERFAVAAGDDHLRALRGEGGGCGESDAAAAAGHEHGLVVEPGHFFSLPGRRRVRLA